MLGATEVWLDGHLLDLGAHKPRAVLAALALSGGRAVSPDSLADLVWGEHPPDGMAGTLQAYVSGLRRVIEPDRAPRAAPTRLVTVPPGYALRVDEDALDAMRFGALVNDVRRGLGRRAHVWDAPALPPTGLAAALERLEEALGLWRGTPYLELGEAPSAVAERGRLEELRLVALEDRATLALALGDDATAAAELEALTAAYPLREQLWALRAVALARGGRQADALDVLARLRTVLDEELGLEPSAPLQHLQTALLRQDPDLVRSPEPAAPRAAAPVAPRQTARSAPSSAPAWPLVGRDAQLGTLVGRLDEAVAGTPAFVALTGDPGIGKTRLCAELVGVARERGVRVVVGRCSQDDGAPPLWPWQQVLSTLGADLDVGGGDDEGAEFRSWDGLVRRVLEAAAGEPLVVVLDDLHWADVSSLRVLRLLLDTVEHGHLLLLATWRAHPEPSGALADVAESLARRHAARLELGGLGVPDVVRILHGVAQLDLTGAQADALASRTDGNPFFLVEYARLARDRGGLGTLVDEADPPTAVGDVLTRRLDRLPEESRRLVERAAVIGRDFELEVLAEVAGVSEDGVLDLLDPVVAAGLVRERRAGDFVFAHALVRDTAYAATGPTRRARVHAAVAAALDRRVGRETESARHWLGAGPAHAARAWRAAASAAASARAVHAYEQAAELLEAALDRMDEDPEASDADRYRLLMSLADAHRWRGAWLSLVPTVHRSLEVAGRIGDVRLLAEAASSLAIGALWQTAAYPETNPQVVAALEDSLRRLPDEDDALRCRVMMALATELYYAAPLAVRAALAEDAVAMARRIGDEQLLVDACEVGFAAIWVPGNAARRLALATEAMERAERLGADRSFVTAATMRAIAEGELGLVAEMEASGAIVLHHAARLHLDFPLQVVESLLLSWHAMRGRFEEAESALARMEVLAERVSIHNADYGMAGALIAIRLWQGRLGEVIPLFDVLGPGPLPIVSLHLVFLLRNGDLDAARAAHDTYVVDLTRVDWYAPINQACAAEAALGLGDPALAAAAYDLMRDRTGETVNAGSGLTLGPVDAFLALAAAALGDHETAAAHADEALRLIDLWDLPLCRTWFEHQRATYAF